MTDLPARPNNHDLTTPADRDPWQDAFNEWLANFTSDNTREAYHRDLMTFGADVGLHPAQVTSQHIIAWREYMAQQELSKATVARRLSAVSSFYAFVNETRRYQHLRQDNPVEGVKRPPVDPYGKALHLQPEASKRLLNSIDTASAEGLRDYAILRLFMTTGVRLAVVAQAQRDDFNNRAGEYYLTYAKKGGKERHRLIPDATAQAIVACLERAGDSEWLFDFGDLALSSRRTMIQRMVVDRCAVVFGDEHGITVHSLRHTAAMTADAAGASITEISGMLDHSNVRVTSIYLSHLDKTSGDKASAMLDDFYS